MKDQGRTPLRTILLNFLNHIENLESRRSPDDSYETEFQELKLFSETLKTLKQYSCSEGEKEVNRKKNRYKDILPFDLSRVILKEYAGIPGSDYINANYIKGASGSPAYIASQGPLPHTVNDFWRMVVQCEVQVIVMACNEEEAGKHKCENYWVEGEGEEKQFGMVTIQLIKASTVCPDFSVRTMRLKYTNTQSNAEERTVCQFHYSAWPDHGVPPLVRPLLDMVRLVRDTQASETLPVLVHCSAGCGRTGTICAIDYVWGLLRAGKLTKDFSLLSLVREMRKQRIAMVQTKEQYVLVHRAVRELFKEQLRLIDSHPYENVDCNGLPLNTDTEPTYDMISNTETSEEKTVKEDKEKEVSIIAPPLPQKKRFPVPSSKHEKEVENLSEKQRIAEQAGSSNENMSGCGGRCVRIANLKSLFERDAKQVSRSHSLGAPRKPQIIKKEPIRPILSQGILRVPQLADQQCPALPVKRSKSLRVLGTSDRYRLSIPSNPPPALDDKARRLSLESNMDVCEREVPQECNYFSRTGLDSVVAGLAVRERRNSFREAVNKTDQNYENLARKPGVGTLVRSYTAIDIRPSNRHEYDLRIDKPVLQPKPSFLRTRDVNVAVSPGNSEDLWQNEKLDTVKHKKKLVSKFGYPDSHNTCMGVRKNHSVLNTSIGSKSTPNVGAVIKPLPRKDKTIVHSTPHLNESAAKQHSSQSNSVGDNLRIGVTKQEGIFRKSPESVHWRQQFQTVFADKRMPNKVNKTVVINSQPKGDLTLHGQSQVSNMLEFSKESHSASSHSTSSHSTPSHSTASHSTSLHSTPSHSDCSVNYNSTPSPQQSQSGQSQTPARYRDSRHVVFDSRFHNQETKNYMGMRHMPGAHVLQRSRQIHPEITSSQTVYHQDSSSKCSGRGNVKDGSQVYKNPMPPQSGNRHNSAGGIDQRHVQHYSDSKTFSSPMCGPSNMSDSWFYSKCGTSNECRKVTDSDVMSACDSAMRAPNYHSATAASNVDHYRSPSFCTVPARQTAPTTAVPNSSRPLVHQMTEPDHTGYGVKLRRGSQDDLALCSPAGGPVTPSRVKRHASVVVLRHSFIETSEASPQLTVWNSPQVNGDISQQNLQFSKESEDPWSGAVGVDLDQVAASMTSQKDGSSSKLMKAALQALHQRKGVTPDRKYGTNVLQHSKTVTTTSSPPQPPFRKQQQYL